MAARPRPTSVWLPTPSPSAGYKASSGRAPKPGTGHGGGGAHALHLAAAHRQQFQRAAALLCAASAAAERVAGGDSRWGEAPFRVGLWVGSKVAPNTFEEAERRVQELQGSERAAGGPLQLLACPWCGSRLSHEDLRTDKAHRRLLAVLQRPRGRCPFTPVRSPGEGIPVLTVDEEIYRLTPALVIGTVDKFAQLPWRAATATLFGLVDQSCPRHGWRNPDFDKFCPPGTRRAGTYLPPTPSLRCASGHPTSWSRTNFT